MAIRINPIAAQKAGTSFVVTGDYDGGSSGLNYSDGAGPAKSFVPISGAPMTVVKWNFIHPGATAGNLKISVRHPTNPLTYASVVVAVKAVAPSPVPTPHMSVFSDEFRKPPF